MRSTSPHLTPISRTGRRMAIGGSLLAGGIAIGTLFSPIGLAGAQDDSPAVASSVDASADTVPTVPGNPPNDTPDPDGRPSRAGHPGRPGGLMLAGGPEFLAELLGLTPAQLLTARADGQTLVEIAASQGMSETDLVAALVEEATVHLAAAVDEGHLDAERAATITDGLEDRITEAVNRVPGDRSGPGVGAGMQPGGLGHGGRLLDAEVFGQLGLDADALRTALRDGSTLAEAAAAQGVSEEDLAAALTTAAEERLAEAVADGRIDADKAAEIQAGIAERVQDHLDGVRGEGPGPRGGHGWLD